MPLLGWRLLIEGDWDTAELFTASNQQGFIVAGFVLLQSRLPLRRDDSKLAQSQDFVVCVDSRSKCRGIASYPRYHQSALLDFRCQSKPDLDLVFVLFSGLLSILIFGVGRRAKL